MRGYPWLAILAVPVVVWRVLAYLTPAPVVPIPEGLALPLTALGFLFLVCGLVAYLTRPGILTFLFFLHCLGSAVHWGGTIGSASRGLELAWFFLYLAASLLGEAALLHLALVYGREMGSGFQVAGPLYGLAGVTALLAPLVPLLPSPILEPIAGIILLLATLSGVVAGVIFIVRLVKADAATRRRLGLGIIVAAMVVSTVIQLLGSGGVLPGPGEAYDLAYALVPVAFLFALRGHP